MLNFIYLMVLGLFLAIMIISVYKYICHKKIIFAIGSFLYIILTVFLTYFIFFSRNAGIENEGEHFLSLLKQGNVFAFFTLFFQIGLIVVAVMNYVHIINLEKIKRRKKKKNE